MSNDNAANSARRFYLENTIKDCKQFLRESGTLQREKIELWAESLEKLGTEKITICAKMAKEAEKEFGWDESQCQYIRNILGPLGYTDSKYAHKGKPTFTLENLIKQTIEGLKELDKEKLKEIGLENPDQLKEYLESTGSAHRLAAYICELLGIITKHEKLQIRTYKPDPSKSAPYNAVVELIPDWDKSGKYLRSVADKMYEFPPTKFNQKEQQEMADRINALHHIIETQNKLLKSCYDEKYSFSLWEHGRMQVREEVYSKHGAAVKSAVQIIDKDGNVTDDFRKMTRERVSDSKEEMFEWMQDMAVAMKAYAYFLGLVEWRDVASEINGRVAERKTRLAPKLSELA